MMWEEKIHLKLTLLNAENLFLLFDHPPVPETLSSFTKMDEQQWQRLSSSVYENKPLHKCKELARAILDIQPDILMLCEVGGAESLKNFNELFLNSEYAAALVEGNSDRNIDVGFLIRKNLPFYFDVISNKNRSINFVYPQDRASKNPQVQKFSRDAVELKLFKKTAESPFLILLLTHLKSRLDPERKDPNGFERRQAELNTLLEIYNELETRHPNTPLVVAGDFNGNASADETDHEFKTIYEKTQLQDVLHLCQISKEERATYFQVKPNGKTEGKQIDFCFLNSTAVKNLKPQGASVFRYKDEFGFKMDSPQSMESKARLPSDHYPLVFELENLKLES